MFLGSMIMGPLGGLVIKYVDKALEKRIPAGFEMVINNFSLGIAGMLLCLLGFEVIDPPDILIQPVCPQISTLDFHRAHAAIAAGQLAVERKMDELLPLVRTNI